MTALWQRLKPLWDDEKRRVQLLAAAGMAGLLLLAVSEWLPAETAAAPPATAQIKRLSSMPPFIARITVHIKTAVPGNKNAAVHKSFLKKSVK